MLRLPNPNDHLAIGAEHDMTELVDSTTFSQGFPVLSGSQIVPRNHILQTIDMAFDGGVDALSLEGQDGIGKTTTLALFAKSHAERCISIFIKPTSRWAYDPTVVVLDLTTQAEWLVTKAASRPEDLIADPARLRTLLYKLGMKAAREKRAYYFVVDGLCEVPTDEANAVEAILDLLPQGARGFKFLFSGELTRLPVSTPPRYKSLPLSPFLDKETIEYLEPLSITRNEIRDLHSVTRGIPGYLASVRRLLESGMTASAVLQEPISDLASMFELEWSRIDIHEPWQALALAIVAHDLRAHTVDDLARLTTADPELMRTFIHSVPVLHVDDKGQAHFVAELIRKVAAAKLAHLRVEAFGLLINDLTRDPDSQDAATFLPGYYQAVNRVDELLSYLTPKHFARTVQATESLVAVRRHAELGLAAADKADRPWDALRFVMHMAALSDSASAGVSEAEIRAYAGLRSTEHALALARSSTLKERRLHGLAVAVSALATHGVSPDPELVAELRRLHAEVDVSVLGEEAIEIAAALMDVAPDLAMDLVEKSAGTQGDHAARDLAFLNLTLRASVEPRTDTDRADTIERIRSRIENPRMRGLSRVLGGSHRSPEDLLLHVKTLETGDDRLFVCRTWTAHNSRLPGALDVAEYALSEGIRSSELSLTAGVLRQLASPLPYADDLPRVQQLVRLFDAQRSTAERVGPTEEFVRLQLLLGRAERRFDEDAAAGRLTEIYMFVGNISDPSTKAACLARILSSLSLVDAKEAAKEQASGELQKELDEVVEQTLFSAADHFEATKNIIAPLSAKFFPLAATICSKLNTEGRRDSAYEALVAAAIVNPIDDWTAGDLLTAVSAIADPAVRNRTVHAICRRLASPAANDPSATATAGASLALRFLTPVRDLRSAEFRAAALSEIIALLHRAGTETHIRLAADLTEELRKTLADIQSPPERIESTFHIVSTLASDAQHVAREFLRTAAEMKTEAASGVITVADSFITCLRLAIRAYAGLLPRRVDEPSDEQRLLALVRRVASVRTRAMLLSDLAVTLKFAGRSERCTELVSTELRPLIAELSARDEDCRADVIRLAAPGLYAGHSVECARWLGTIDDKSQDFAYWGICLSLLSRRPAGEPHDRSRRRGFDARYSELLEVCTLLKQIGVDHIVYAILKDVVDTMLDDRNRYKLTREQRSVLIVTIQEVILAKLPSARGVTHEGYRIAAEAQVARAGRPGRATWDALAARARGIPNLPDRTLVLGILGTAMSGKEGDLRQQVFAEAEALAHSIPITGERIGRYESLAIYAGEVDRAYSRRILDRAMRDALGMHNSDAVERQRSLLDSAYQIDPELAQSLGSLVDDDQARGRQGQR